MQELIKYVESKHLKPKVTDCRIGDTVRVMVKVKEGTGKDERTRLQAYEGVVIARTGTGINESLRVRRVTHGVGVERVFPLHSPIIEEILTVRHGKVRRSKLYYLRTRVGKKARVPEQSRDVVAARETARKELEAAEAAAAAAAAAATTEESAE